MRVFFVNCTQSITRLLEDLITEFILLLRQVKSSLPCKLTVQVVLFPRSNTTTLVAAAILIFSLSSIYKKRISLKKNFAFFTGMFLIDCATPRFFLNRFAVIIIKPNQTASVAE